MTDGGVGRCGHSGRLPSSHTCFNQLDLPEYPSSEVLQRCLLSAIREGFEGFGAHPAALQSWRLAARLTVSLRAGFS